MDSPSEYLVVAGSLRAVSRSRVLAQTLLDFYRSRQLSARLLDLRERSLPLCDAGDAYEDPSVVECAKAILHARVIILATPIYNFDVSAAVKNLIELTGDSWEDKVVGFLCAAGGRSSYMSVMALANSLMLDFRCLIIPRFVFVTSEDLADSLEISDAVRTRVCRLGETSINIRNWVQADEA